VNVKAKTHEQLDSLGNGLAVEAHVIVLLQYIGRNDTDLREQQEGE
jgi:2C-methyl-D-erythritol 2,4-cyclodiphosphate synthase